MEDSLEADGLGIELDVMIFNHMARADVRGHLSIKKLRSRTPLQIKPQPFDRLPLQLPKALKMAGNQHIALLGLELFHVATHGLVGRRS